jgi:hypothetical protein
MSTFVRFLHWAGFSIWLGAQLTFMVWVPLSRTVALEPWAHVWKTLAKLQRWVVAPSAVVATLTGFALTMQLASREREAAGAAWLVGMQVTGVLAAILALALVAPLSNRMGWIAEQSLADGAKHPAAETVRTRLALAGTVTGLFILAAIWFGAMAPPAGGGQ